MEPTSDQQHLDDHPENEFVSRQIEYCDDDSQSIISENHSPDVPFRYSLNPYRGCIHGCSYCYARPSHEYLGFNAGLDFETKIVVKRQAPLLFRRFLSRKSWQPEPIAFSGVTDCYQPAEQKFELTRQCLKVALQCRQPLGIVTKNALVLRDLDLLRDLAEHDLLHVFVSVTTLQPQLAQDMEPRTTIPQGRIRTIQRLADAGIPVGVMVAPIIPGLNDSEVPTILSTAASAGACAAGYVLLRLPLAVEPVFREWLERTQGDKAQMVLGRIKATRQGKENDSTFGTRMVGTGELAKQIRSLFLTFASKNRLHTKLPPRRSDLFRRPSGDATQLPLF